MKKFENQDDKGIVFRPVGYIKSDHKTAEKTPVQPVFAQECSGEAIINEEFSEGLKGLEEFSHIIIIYHLHKARDTELLVKPFLDDRKHGIFATRFPKRPNKIGFSVVQLCGREGCSLKISGVDMLNGTPILDIKPFVRRFDFRADTKDGWYEKVDEKTAQKKGRRGFKPHS
ncbi:tRNA (N6-threonylcarbamoyladenosine(37)-N6)-methyltransferase TrmO [Candidatus Riflebacteria bacterium]